MFSKIFGFSMLLLIFKFYNTCTSDQVDNSNGLLHRHKRQLLFLNQSFLQLKPLKISTSQLRSNISHEHTCTYLDHVQSRALLCIHDRFAKKCTHISNHISIKLSQNNFNVGITAPTASEMVKVNYVIQAQFTLPWNTSQIPTDGSAGFVSTGRGKRETNVRSIRKNYENDSGLFNLYKYIEEVLNGYGYNGTACTLQTLCQLAADPIHTEDKEDLFHELASFIFTPTNDIQDGITPRDAHIYIHAHKEGVERNNCNKLYDCGFSLVDRFTYTVHEQKDSLNN